MNKLINKCNKIKNKGLEKPLFRSCIKLVQISLSFPFDNSQKFQGAQSQKRSCGPSERHRNSIVGGILSLAGFFSFLFF